MTAPSFTPMHVDFAAYVGETLEDVQVAAQDAGGLPVDFTGYSARLEVHTTDGLGTLVLEADTAANTITNGGTAGTFTVAPSVTVPNTPGVHAFEWWVRDTLGGEHPWWVGSFRISSRAETVLP